MYFLQFSFYGKYDIFVNCGKSRKHDIYVERFYENIVFHAVCFFLIKNRSSRPEVFCEKVVLKNFTKFTGKHLCQVPGLDLHRRFPVNFVKFLRAPFSIKRILWLLH